MARKRPKLSSKEELFEYLAQNSDTELPFNEEVWVKAVEFTENKEQKFKEIETTDYDGTVKIKKIPNGAISPVGKYFQLMALPQYQKQTIEDNFDYNDEAESDYELSFEDEEKEETVASWLSTFFFGYKAEDKKFLKDRLADYYDNYELNEGADKLIAVSAVADELEIMRLTKERQKGKDIEARLEKVRKGYMASLDSLKALKKQRGIGEEGKNKLTQWIDELEAEGKFVEKKDLTYTKDDIDFMLEQFEEGMRATYYEG